MSDEAIAALSAWVLQESHSHDPAGVNAMMDLVLAAIGDAPVAAERIPGRHGLGDMVILRAGPQIAAAPVLLLSHLDTVHPKGTLASGLPLRRDGDRLYGPGIYDMKGGAWLALQAFCDVAKAGSAQRPMIYLFTPDEEIGSPTGREVIRDLARGARAALVTEPARQDGRIVTARKGTGRFEMRLQGVAAHAGTHHANGRSAVLEAARQVIAIEALTDHARGVTFNVGLISGGTSTNVVPEHASFSIDCRASKVEDWLWLEAQIMALRPVDPQVSLTITGRLSRPPYEKTDEITQLLALARGVAAKLGVTLEDCPMTGGGSDGNLTAELGVPTLDGLGIDGGGAHTLQEFGLISSIPIRQSILHGILRTL